jgi:hypothetical protein
MSSGPAFASIRRLKKGQAHIPPSSGRPAHHDEHLRTHGRREQTDLTLPGIDPVQFGVIMTINRMSERP